MRILIIQGGTGGLDGTVRRQPAGARPPAFEQGRQTRWALVAPKGGDR
jgi:hypothetical protein